MRLILILFFLFNLLIGYSFFIVSEGQANQNKLLFTCYEDSNTGFAYNFNKWQSTSFNRSSPFYIYRDLSGDFLLYQDNRLIAFINTKETSEFYFWFRDGFQNFVFDRKEHKYTYAYLGGAVNNSIRNTPQISIGRCIANTN